MDDITKMIEEATMLAPASEEAHHAAMCRAFGIPREDEPEAELLPLLTWDEVPAGTDAK